MRHDRIRALITPLLMLCAIACVVTGVFLIYIPAGWIVTGAGLAFVAYVTDQEGTTP